MTFAPTSEPAVRYNEPVEAPPHTPLGDAVLVAVKDAATTAKVAMPMADGRLFRACAELAQVVPEDGLVATGIKDADFNLSEAQRIGVLAANDPAQACMHEVSAGLEEAETAQSFEPRVSDLISAARGNAKAWKTASCASW